ncbi:MAG TPA: hypothetical protein VGD78_06675 [Chthoniobacterales bacterium]
MGFDIRLPIGYLFTILGAVLVLFGLVTDPAVYERSLGININLWWGIALLVFGLVMTFAARRARSRAVQNARPQAATTRPRVH